MRGEMKGFVFLGCQLLASLLLVAAEDETAAWQGRIDSAAMAGGGVVSVPSGRHLVGQLDLKSNVELRLEKGAVLEGIVGLEHYRVTTLPYSEGTWSAIVSAIGVTNVAITGEGEIFGNGKPWKIPEDYGGNQEGLRARGIFFADSERIRLTGFTLRDAACWGVVFKCCRHVRIKGVTIDNHANSNNDGFDIEASDVVIEDCDVDAGDDAYCLKSNNPHFTVEDVIVRNCIARSHSNGCKIGTATHGTIRNVLFENIVCRAPRRDFIDNRKTSPNFGKPHFYRPELLHLPAGGGLGAVTIECVDGGRVENVIAKGIEVSGFIAPIFVRAGTRTGRDCGTPPGNQYVFRNIRIENVHGRSETPIASSVSGVDGCRVKDVVLKDIDIVCPGADAVASWQALETPVPDVSGLYPECTMFRPSILPAYGLYVDRVDGISLENVRFRLKDGSGDVRPPVFLSRSVSGVRQIRPPVRGKRVMLLGDSITHFGFQTYYLQLFEALRYPGSEVRFANAGISGGSLGTGIRNYECEFDAFHPDQVVIMYGMNDVKWMAFATNGVLSAGRKDEADRLLTKYRQDYCELVDKVRASGVTNIVLVTPTPYDEYSTSIHAPRRRHVNEYGLKGCARIVRELAAERGLGLVDLNAPMTELCQRFPEVGWCGGDRVHPRRIGNLFMAYRFLRTWGEVSPCAMTTVVTNVCPGKTFAFDYQPKSLPFPPLSEFIELKRYCPEARDLNQEILAFRGLGDGMWRMTVDGRDLGTFDSDELSRGVNVAELDTPSRQAAVEAAKAMTELRGFDQTIRDAACVRNQLESVKAKTSASTFAEAAAVYLAKERTKRTPPSYRSLERKVKAFLDTEGCDREFQEKREALISKMIEARPVKFTLELRKVTPRKVLNIVNFVRSLDPRIPKPELVRALDEEVKLNLRYGFPNTLLLQYDALIDGEMLATARRSDSMKTEYGLWFEMSRPLNESAGLEWRPSERHKDWNWDWFINPGFLMAYDQSERRRLIDAAFAKFREVFGDYPKSVGSWLLDAYSMDYMVERYGVDGFCICREQDSTDAYGLRGGYSNGAYYPSRRNMLSAAVEMENAVRAPVFKMLTPDPIYNYGRPSKLYADYPFAKGCPTLEPVWKTGFDPQIVDWFFRVYTESPGLLNLSYLQAGQENSFGWNEIAKGWPMQCAKIAALRDAGRIAVETMGETARRFKSDHPANCPQTQVALEDWNDGRRKSIWYNSRFYRANLICEDGRLFFRDIHKMTDDFEEPFLKRKCAGWRALYFTPPVIDQWLFRGGNASGVMSISGKHDTLSVTTEGDSTLVVTSRCGEKEGVSLRFEEGKLVVRGGALSAEYEEEFLRDIRVLERAVEYSFSGYWYQVPISGSLCRTSNGFSVGGNEIVLDMTWSR